MAKQPVQDVCPNCGDFTDYLVNETGWCFKCSAPELLGNEEGEVKVCPGCNKRFIPKNIRICRTCRKTEFLEKNADEIDRQLADHRLDLVKAIEATKQSKVTKCLCCGAPLKPATRGTAYFCARKSECRTAYNKLHRYIYTLHKSRDEALKLVLEELNAKNNRTNPQA